MQKFGQVNQSQCANVGAKVAGNTSHAFDSLDNMKRNYI